MRKVEKHTLSLYARGLPAGEQLVANINVEVLPATSREALGADGIILTESEVQINYNVDIDGAAVKCVLYRNVYEVP